MSGKDMCRPTRLGQATSLHKLGSEPNVKEKERDRQCLSSSLSWLGREPNVTGCLTATMTSSHSELTAPTDSEPKSTPPSSGSSGRLSGFCHTNRKVMGSPLEPHIITASPRYQPLIWDGPLKWSSPVSTGVPQFPQLSPIFRCGYSQI